MLNELPKVLLHDHLDGGLRVQTIIELAQEHGYRDLPSTDPAELAEWFDQGNSGSLESYLEAFTHTVGVMMTQSAVSRIAYEACLDLAADGVVYAEIRFAPSLCERLSLHEVIEAVLDGFSRGRSETGMIAKLIVDAMRNGSDSEEVARASLDFKDQGVVGFDLAGPELGYPPDNHLPAIKQIHKGLLGLTLHAGEGDGPHSIWRALAICGAQRIGHGIHIVEDCLIEEGEIVGTGELASWIRDRSVTLEICPTSNLHTHGWQPQEHPVGMLHRAGFSVTINTDNRLMSRTSMSREFDLLAHHHGFQNRDFKAVTLTALDAAFCSWDERQKVLEKIESGYDV